MGSEMCIRDSYYIVEMSCTDVVTENCDDADLFVSLDTRDLEQADLIELVANATLR